MFMAVDLPEPDGPMIATNSPAPMRRLTAVSAETAASPEPNTLPTSWNSMSAGGFPSLGIVASSARSGGIDDHRVALLDLTLQDLGPLAVTRSDRDRHCRGHMLAQHPYRARRTAGLLLAGRAELRHAGHQPLQPPAALRLGRCGRREAEGGVGPQQRPRHALHADLRRRRHARP